MVALASGKDRRRDESTVELEQTEDDTLAAKVSDEALEAAAAGTMGEITFTFSIHPIYCRFC